MAEEEMVAYIQVNVSQPHATHDKRPRFRHRAVRQLNQLFMGAYQISVS
jgi:hypothetical protein